jgi:flagellar basal body P-ring formation protein FlgA
VNKTLALAAAGLAVAASTQALGALQADVAQAVREIAADASQRVSAAVPGARVQVQVGELDPRLKLAPCEQVQPYLPPNARLWGRARIGLRCLRGPVRWNVYLPVTVSVYARGLIMAGPVAAGSAIGPADLREAEVDLAAGSGTAVIDPDDALGRSLVRPLAAGAALRSTDLKVRQWFAAGDNVKIVAAGSGYAVSGEGQALSAGLDGQSVRIRTESGRIVTGVAVSERRVALSL